MAFPQVRSNSSGGEQGAAVTDFDVTLPGTVENGDLLLVYFVIDAPNDETVTFPGGDGWSQQFDELYTSVFRGICYKKLADGTEDSEVITATIGGSGSRGHYICHAIQDWDGALAGVESSAPAQSFGTAPDPASLSPSWGAEDTLWITLWQGHNSNGITSYPTNYTADQLSILGAYTNEAVATRELNASSEDVGAWTMTTSRQNIATTLAVRPASAGVVIEVPVGPVW